MEVKMLGKRQFLFIFLSIILSFSIPSFAVPFNPDFGISDLFLVLFSIVISNIIPGLLIIISGLLLSNENTRKGIINSLIGFGNGIINAINSFIDDLKTDPVGTLTNLGIKIAISAVIILLIAALAVEICSGLGIPLTYPTAVALVSLISLLIVGSYHAYNVASSCWEDPESKECKIAGEEAGRELIEFLIAIGVAKGSSVLIGRFLIKTGKTIEITDVSTNRKISYPEMLEIQRAELSKFGIDPYKLTNKEVLRYYDIITKNPDFITYYNNLKLSFKNKFGEERTNQISLILFKIVERLVSWGNLNKHDEGRIRGAINEIVSEDIVNSIASRYNGKIFKNIEIKNTNTGSDIAEFDYVILTEDRKLIILEAKSDKYFENSKLKNDITDKINKLNKMKSDILSNPKNKENYIIKGLNHNELNQLTIDDFIN
ncbi:MAG: hypothetical protein QXY29_02335, partial [Candidatus Aenigmatarchaeota archaeon]